MTIADEKLKSASARHMLFKVTPKKHLASSLSVYSTNFPFTTYVMDLVHPVEKILLSGFDIPETIAIPTAGSLYYHDEDQGKLYISNSEDLTGSSFHTILYFNLFFTGETTRYVNEDPLDSGSAIREWQPKITKYPSINQSVKNITAGVFSISSISLEIIDTDDLIKDLLDIDTTLNGSSVTGWQSINNTYEKIYQGKVKSIKPRDSNVTLSILDNFSNLNSEASMGDSEDEIFADRDTYPDLDKNIDKTPIPFFFGKTTQTINHSNEDINFNGSYRGLALGSNEAINIANATDGVQGGDDGLTDGINNLFILGRVGPGGIATQFEGTISAVSHPIDSEFVTVTASGHNFKYGDAFGLSRSGDSNFDAYAYVVEVSVGSYKIMTVTPSFDLKSPSNASEQLTVGNISFDGLHKSIQIRFYLGSPQTSGTNSAHYTPPMGFFPLAGTYIEETLASGNKLIKLNLDKLQLGFLQPFFDPSKHKIIFSMTPADTSTHSEIVGDICSLAGLETNSASFTQAQTDLSESCLFQIPFKGQSQYPTYHKVVEKILQSTFGILYLDNELEVNYQILSLPSLGDDTNDSSILARTSRVLIEYNDVQTKIEGNNKHYNNTVSTSFGDTPFASEENTKAKYLNGFDKKQVIEHVLENFDSQAAKILGFLSKRRVEYSFDIATELVDKIIGDDLSLSTFVLIGGSVTENVKIIGLKKSNNKTTALTIDLKGL